jgi:hypothetical protein
MKNMKEKKMNNFIRGIFAAAMIAALAFSACRHPADNLSDHTHKWGEWEIITPATCKTTGVETRVCVLDTAHNETRPIDIDPSAHDWHQLSGTAPTCTTDGNGTRKCSLCSKEESGNLAALGHKYENYKVTKAPTCSAGGIETGICSHDSTHTTTRDIPIDPDAHDWQQLSGTAPTCTTDGNGKRKCNLCSEEETLETIPALGHQWANNWKITTPPTIVQGGIETDTCTHNTSHTRTRSITTAIFTDITDFETYLSGLSDNTAAAAYTVKLNVNNLGGDVNTSGSVGNTLSGNSAKFVSLDLSSNAITGIGDSAFLSCTNLTSVNIPNSVTSIGDYAFNGCTGLASVTLPVNAGFTSIGNSAFNRCISLTGVNIPNSVTSIGIAAFQSCAGLTSITIPTSVTDIKGSVFNRCTGLTSVTIPGSVKSIGDWGFGNNTNLTSVTFQGTIPAADFNSMGSFFGDLRDKFYASNSTNGTTGTYTTTAPVSASSVWTKK